jgi:hypothetical protein
MKYFYFILAFLSLFLNCLSCKQVKEEPIPRIPKNIVENVEEQPQGEAVNRMRVADKDAKLTLATISETVIGINLENKIPIRGVQFTIKGTKITDVRTTTRTKGYLSKFNEASGMVMLVDLSGGQIEVGKGSIAEVVCDKSDSAILSDVKLAKKL